jgi:hypothetical protein
VDAWQVIVAVTLPTLGIISAIFGLLHYNRDEAGKVVDQQGKVLSDINTLYEVMKEERNEARGEVKEAVKKISDLEIEVAGLRGQISSLQQTINQLMTGLHHE